METRRKNRLHQPIEKIDQLLPGRRRCFALLGSAIMVFSLIAGPPAAEAVSSSRIEKEWKENSSTAHFGPLSLTPGGNLLVVRNGYAGPSVVELGENGQKLWEYGPVQANAAVRLPNGNTLICDSGAPGPPAKPRVIEVSPTGAILWQYLTSNRAEAPQYAQRLSNGNTLVTLPNRVLEVDTAGKQVWSSPVAFHRAVQANRIEGNKTLIVDRGLGGGGKVTEINSSGQIIWEYPGRDKDIPLHDPVSAWREGEFTHIADLKSDCILTVDQQGVLVKQVNWREVTGILPIANRWAFAWGNDNTIYLSLSYTSGSSTVLRLNDRSISLFLNDKLTTFNPPPVLSQDQPMVPARVMVDLCSGSLDWDQASQKAFIRGPGGTLSCTVGSSEAVINGRTGLLPSAPILYNNKTLMVPISTLSGILGIESRWDENSGALYLYTATRAHMSAD